MIPRGRLSRAGHLAGALVGAATQRGAGAAVLGRLKGGAQKLGQTVALATEGLPGDVRERLGALFTAGEPRPWAEVRPILEAALPTGLLLELDEVSFAAASLGQVHRGRLADGREVAVKVLYPGVGEALRADLDNLSVAALPARAVAQGTAMLTGLRGALLDELDLRTEARHAATIHSALRLWPRVEVPEVHFASEQVLVTTLLAGPTLHALLRPEGEGSPDPTRLGDDLVAAMLGPLFSARVINADAHPGNVIVRPNGLGLVDFGAVADVPDVDRLDAALDAALAGRTTGLLEELGLDVGPLEADLLPILGPLRRGAWDFADGALLEHLREVKRRRPLALRKVPFPPGRLPLIRALLGLHHALARLGVPFALGESLERVRIAARAVRAGQG